MARLIGAPLEEDLLPVALHVALLQIGIAVGDLTRVAGEGMRGGRVRVHRCGGRHDVRNRGVKRYAMKLRDVVRKWETLPSCSWV